MSLTLRSKQIDRPKYSETSIAIWPVFDLFFAFLLLTAAADFYSRTGMQSEIWMLCYAAALLRISLVLNTFVHELRNQVVFLLFPFACLASSVWSADLETGLVSSAQLMLTIVFSIFLGWRYSVDQIALIVFSALSLGIVLSLFHNFVSVFPWPANDGGQGLNGIFTHRNALGRVSVVCILSCIAVCFLKTIKPGAKTKSLIYLTAAASATTVLLSNSITAFLVCPAVLLLFFAFQRHRLPDWLQLASVLAVLLSITLVPLFFAVFDVDPVQILLERTGKDATLTGRTEIWRIAAEQIRAAPISGHGYGSFWSSSQFENQRLLIVIAGNNAPSFHNFILEILVSVGLIGLSAMTFLIATTSLRLIRLHKLTRSAGAAFGLAATILAVFFALLGTELYRPHEFFLVLVVMLGVSSGIDIRNHTQRRARYGVFHPHASARPV